MCKMRVKRGFTLIELSIVLVIIGLIVGGVLVGRDLIHAAEIRKVITQREQFDTATNTFRLKFNCLPGDCKSAGDIGVGDTAEDVYGENGNGDGKISNNTWSQPLEPINFWYHLAKSSLIGWAPDPAMNYSFSTIACNDGTTDTSPCLAFSASAGNGSKGGWWIISTTSLYCGTLPSLYTLSSQHYWWLTAVVGSGGSDQSAILIPVDAYAIDKKIDDGLPLSGIIFAAGDNNEDPCGPTNPSVGAGGILSDTCVDISVSPNAYNLRNINRTSTNMCSMLIRTGF
jgi:prepilin-type N-terminal cleavage/methylation domain-containing protein